MKKLIVVAAVLAPLATAPALAGDAGKTAMTPMPDGTAQAAGNPCFHGNHSEVAAPLPPLRTEEKRKDVAQAKADDDSPRKDQDGRALR